MHADSLSAPHTRLRCIFLLRMKAAPTDMYPCFAPLQRRVTGGDNPVCRWSAAYGSLLALRHPRPARAFGPPVSGIRAPDPALCRVHYARLAGRSGLGASVISRSGAARGDLTRHASPALRGLPPLSVNGDSLRPICRGRGGRAGQTRRRRMVPMEVPDEDGEAPPPSPPPDTRRPS